MKIGDIQFYVNLISWGTCNIIGVLYNTSNISNITISGDKGDIGDRITLPTPVETLWRGVYCFGGSPESPQKRKAFSLGSF
jgi:hypothetical protein